jgi:hypothetical protein
MTAEREQNWQPITMLPMFTEVVTGMLDGAAEQQQLLASARPYSSLDHATLDRVERVYRDGLDGHEAFENQLARWQREHPGAEGLAELGEQVGQLRPAYQRVLDLAAQQRDNTIEALMGKSDAQVGLEALLGGPLPDNDTDRPGKREADTDDIFDTLFADEPDDTEQPTDRRGQLAKLVFDLIGGYLDQDTDRVAQIVARSKRPARSARCSPRHCGSPHS